MRVALLLWPDTFEDWYDPLGITRRDFLDGYDGEWTISAAAAMRSAGAEVHLVYNTLRSAERAIQQPSGATVHFVPATAAYRGLRRAVWGHRYWQRTAVIWPVSPVFSTLSWRLMATLHGLRPDAVIVQDYESLRFDMAAPLLHGLGLRVVGIDTGGSARPSRLPWKGLTTRCADRLLAANRGELERARRQRRHADVAVWPVPVRTDVFVPGDRAAARAGLGVDPAVRMVVSAGRLHPVKGLNELADACRDLDCDLVLVGSGAQAASLAGRGDPRLRLVGRLPAAEVARWYTAADVVALASHREGQPAAVLEALSCARAVVATAVGGVPEVIVPGETGWLVPPRDVPALRAALAEALGDRAAADRLGAEGRRRTVIAHSREAVGAELLHLAARP